MQLILVEPDTRRLGWGVAKLVGFLQDIEVIGDKDDSRCLHITIHKSHSSAGPNRVPLLSAKFIFDDHIRCMAAKQRLTKGRVKARAKKMQHIARLLEIPGSNNGSTSSLLMQQGSSRLSGARGPREHRPLFTTANRVPGFAAALRRESLPGSVSRIQLANRQAHSGNNESMGSYYSNSVLDGENQSRRNSANNGNKSKDSSPQRLGVRHEGMRSRESSNSRSGRSRDGSPKMPRPRSEEIPLEDLRKSQSPSPVPSTSTITIQARPQTPKFPENSSMSIVEDILTEENSEETSFIASETTKSKRKGVIETV